MANYDEMDSRDPETPDVVAAEPAIEETPVPVPKEPTTPVLRPDQQAAAAYLEKLGATGAPAEKPLRQDDRAGKRPPPPNQPEPKLSARQFVRARKQRWERCAGFLSEMKRQLGPGARLTMHEWDPLWTAFWNRPVGPCRR